MSQTTIILFGEEAIEKTFLTDYKKRQIRQFFGAENATPIRSVTQPAFDSLYDYLQYVISTHEDESPAVLNELITEPKANLQRIVHALSRYTVSYLNDFIQKDKVAWKVRQLQAGQAGKSLTMHSLLAALYWGMLHALMRYRAENDVPFSFCVFSEMRQFASRHVEDQTGIRIVGSFLGKNSRKQYFEAKYTELTTGIPQVNPYLEKLRAAFPESS